MPAPTDKHQLIRTFCSVSEYGSFSKAATNLRLPASSVTKHVQQLEQQLNTQLIVRSTRSMQLTAAGQLFYQKGCSILRQLDELEQQTRALSGAAAGRLRVSLPLLIGEQILCPVLSEFNLAYPDISLELDLSHRPVSLLEQDVDIAFRTSLRMPDSGLYEMKLMELQPVYVASPAYLKNRGEPADPDDLRSHNNLVFDGGADAGGRRALLGSKQRMNIVSNSHKSLITAASAGCGIACVYDVLVTEAIAEGNLVEVLRAFRPDKKQLSIVYRQRTSGAAKIQAFLSFFREYPGIH